MDVGDFLRELGLQQYEAAFRENDVDAEVLPKLTADDLKELGVALVGHRRRLLEAIAALASRQRLGSAIPLRCRRPRRSIQHERGRLRPLPNAARSA